MSEPLIFFTKFRVREGKVAELKRYLEKISEIVAANEPRIIAFIAYLNEDRTEMTSIQVHPDTASMELHLRVLQDNWDESFSEYAQWLEGVSIDYYGNPPEASLEMDRRAGASPGLNPIHLAGFVRSPAG